LEALSSAVDARVSSVNDAAQRQHQVTGGKQTIKRQMQSLKSTILNLGQKEAFAEGEQGCVHVGPTCTHPCPGPDSAHATRPAAHM
jgi:hypothetical protein